MSSIMDLTAASTPSISPAADSSNSRPKIRPRRPNYNYIHRNLLPIEIHPLPVLIPHNPLSLVAIALSYLTQILAPPSQPLYDGHFSSSTSSIQVTNPMTIRKLWEMGFFGKGSLSRSEPTWLESQKRKGETSEEATGRRRAERREAKLERAKKEQEEIAKKLREENRSNIKTVGSGNEDLHTNGRVNGDMNGRATKIDMDRLDDIASVLESGSGASTPDGNSTKPSDGRIHGYDEWKKAVEDRGLPTPPPTSTSSEASNVNGYATKNVPKIKTVRFSPTTEAREFDLSAPIISPIKSPGRSSLPKQVVKAPPTNENQEHLQLSQEEAFFLVYGLGVLRIHDDSDTMIPASSLLSLFRRHSYFPPRSISAHAEPDDPFMLSYAVYHHYRSLGWVVRSGVKFSVDYLLYNRGPAFSHAEFAVIILPSYSHPYWSESEERRIAVQKKTGKTWWWLHCVNRVQSQVKKSLVLCYVDIPPPVDEDATDKNVDIGGIFSRYKVRDINVKRWTPNRSRD